MWENKRIDGRYRHVPVDIKDVALPPGVDIFGERPWFNRDEWLGPVTPPDDGRRGHADNRIDISIYWFIKNSSYIGSTSYWRDYDCTTLDDTTKFYRLAQVAVPGTSYFVNVDLDPDSKDVKFDTFWGGQNEWVMVVEPKPDLFDPAIHEAAWNKSNAPLVYIGPLPIAIA